jgi:hypothetical protein
MGRRTERPRYNVISFRLCAEEMEQVLKCAESADQKRGDLARDLVMQGVRSRLAGGSDAE